MTTPPRELPTARPRLLQMPEMTACNVATQSGGAMAFAKEAAVDHINPNVNACSASMSRDNHRVDKK